MTKRRWLYLILLFVPVLLIIQVVSWWNSQLATVSLETLPNYPGSKLIPSNQFDYYSLSLQFCYPNSITIEDKRIFATKDSIEQVAVYYAKWASKQNLQLASIPKSPSSKGQSNYCLIRSNALIDPNIGLGFAYFSSSTPESAKKIKDFFPGLLGETNVIIFLRGIVYNDD